MVSIEVLIEVVAQRHTDGSADELHIVVEILVAEQSLDSRFYALCNIIGKEVLFHNNGNDAVIVYLDGLFFQTEVSYFLSLTSNHESWFVRGVASHETADEPTDELLDDHIVVPYHEVIFNTDLALLQDSHFIKGNVGRQLVLQTVDFYKLAVEFFLVMLKFMKQVFPFRLIILNEHFERL